MTIKKRRRRYLFIIPRAYSNYKENYLKKRLQTSLVFDCEL